MRVGLIGYGQIGRSLHRAIAEGLAGPDVELAMVLVRDPSRGRELVAEVAVTDELERFLDSEIEIVVEVAGHAALRAYVQPVLESGRSLLTVSVGAFADHAFLESVEALASDVGQRVLIPSGAIGGLDMISAAALAPLQSVTHTTRKPPAAFSAEQLAGAAVAAEAKLLFDGPAREGVGRFPENVNVAAAVSLAGIGLDRTRLRVFADPQVRRNVHEVEVVGHFGRLSVRVENEPSENPKTGRVVPLSVAKALRNLSAPIVVGL